MVMNVHFLLTLFVTVVYADEPLKTQSIGSRYGFYRQMEHDVPGATRRIFGGSTADLNTYPAVAALLDRFWVIRCSASVITPVWALTAAHCATSRVAYIKYNTRHPTANEGNVSPVLYLYRHPNYKVVQEDEGRGMDVTLLHHDLGLVRSRDVIVLNSPIQPLSSMRLHNPADLENREITVMGFGRTDDLTHKRAGEELLAVKLQSVQCTRKSWLYCMCGTSVRGQSQKGVCSGDSGGPVLYNGVQVGVTSMGPLECASPRTDVAEGATSVFTSTFHYVDLINSTMHAADQEIKLSREQSKLRHASSADVFKLHLPLVISLFVMYL